MDFKEGVYQEALKNETKKIKEISDGLMIHTPSDGNTNSMNDASIQSRDEDLKVVIDEEELEDTIREETFEDSDYDSETSESEDEFMPDGERVRKTSRGFKQISNCKRFWRASILTG